MPHGWRLPARSAASPRGCTAEDGRLEIPDAVTGAFADRTRIDWSALLERVRDPRDRAPIEALRALDLLRGPQPASLRSRGAPLPVFLLRLLVALAALQTALAPASVLAAMWDGRSVAALTPQLLVASAFAAASVLLASASARDRRVLLLVATFTFAGSAFARAVVGGLPGQWPGASSGVFRGLYPEAFVPAALWQFAVLFPAVHRFARFDVWARRAACAAWLLSTSLFAANFAVAHGLRATLLTMLERDDPRNLFWNLFAAAALPAFAAIFARAFRSSSAERGKAIRFGGALGAGAAPLLLTGMARLAVPGVDGWMRGAPGLGRLALDSLILGALAAMPLLATLAIVVDRPFELEAILPGLVRRWWREPPVATLERAPARLWRRSRGYERLTSALDRVREAGASGDAVDVLRRELQFGAGARSVAVLDARGLPSETALLVLLQESSGPIVLARDAEPFVLLPRLDREWLVANDVALIAPMRGSDGTVASVAVLGPRAGGGPYDAMDLWFVAALVGGAAAARGDGRVSRDGDNSASECTRCGMVWDAAVRPCACDAAPEAAALPKRLAGKFVVVRRLGAGGMGVVYLGRDTALHRDVALKTLPAMREGSVARLRDEAQAMAALNHSSLATIYGLEFWRRTPVLVVEYLAGGTLADKLPRGLLPQHEVVALGLTLADALTYMHARGVLHRDLKPGNIGFTADGTPKLLDFGLSADFASPAGTPDYLPPEALAGELPDAAVDLWGLATVLLHAGGAACADLAPFFDRALALTRADRFQSSAELRAGLIRAARRNS